MKHNKNGVKIDANLKAPGFCTQQMLILEYLHLVWVRGLCIYLQKA